MEMTVLVQCRDDWFREQERAVYLIETRHVNIDFSLLKFSLIDRNIERGDFSGRRFLGGGICPAPRTDARGQSQRYLWRSNQNNRIHSNQSPMSAFKTSTAFVKGPDSNS